MTFERARAEDICAIGGILDAARAYLKEQGLDQWQQFPPTPEDTRAHVARGEQYVVREDGHIAGVCAVIGHEPAYDAIDGAWLQNGAYLAIHRVAASPAARRKGVASALFRGAEALARERGVRALRIDTHAGNLPMRRALEKNAFVYCGKVTIATGETRVAYEKILEDDMQKIVAATGNAHKLKEIRAIFAGREIVSEKEAGFAGEIEETGETFLENALIKARAVCEATGLPALADDSGLCVDALGGAPGVRSARYSGGGDAENRVLLLKNMANVTDRGAHFCCAVALVFPDGRVVTAEGRTEGEILTEECGENGFGYDSLFFSRDLQKSFASAAEEEKNAVSHRGRALRALEAKL